MRVLLGIIILLTQTFLQIFGQDKYFREYGQEAGLNSSFLYAMSQDSEGYLWIGSANGLYRFNGIEFQHYTDKDSLAENFITCIHADLSGELWLGHMNGGITHISEKGSEIHRENSSDITSANSSITSITESDSGTIWFSTQNDGLFVLLPGKQLSRITSPVEDELIMFFKHVSNNIYLLGTQENLYLVSYSVEAGVFEEKVKVENFPYSRVADIIKDNQAGYIVISQDEGIFRLTMGSELPNYILEEIINNENGDFDNAQGALCVNDNELWVYTMGNGVLKLHRDINGDFLLSGNMNAENGLISNDVQCMYIDLEGNIWLSIYGEGLLRLVDDNLKFFSFPIASGISPVYSLGKKGNDIWISLENSLTCISTDDGVSKNTYPFPAGINASVLNSIYCSDEGLIYLGFDKAGVYTFNPRNEEFVSIIYDKDDLKNSVNHITGKGSIVWISTKKGVIKYDELTGLRKHFLTIDGLPHNNVQQMFVDSKDRAFLATKCKIIHFIDQDNNIDTLPRTSSMGNNSVISIAEDDMGTIWVATKGNGVYAFSNEDSKNFNRVSGLLSEYCYGLVFDASQGMIVSHRGGFSHIDTETSRIKSYSQYEGISSSTDFHPNALLVDRLENIWFGTSEGIIKYLPQITDKGLAPPLLHIDAVYFNKQKIDYSENIEFKAGTYQIEIAYTGIKLNHPEMVSYQSYLEGYSSDWSDISFQRRVNYEKVGPGEYTFNVIAYNMNGVPNEDPLTLSIHIKKPFYITWWFILTIISIFVLIVSAYIKLREQILIREKTVLEEKVKERTEEVIQQNLTIAEKNKHITSSINYGKRIQQAMLPRSDTFEDTFVLYMPKDIVSGDFYWMHDDGETKYLVVADCTGHGVPGAFMTFIGQDSLNKIVKEYGIKKPSAILDRLNIEISNAIIQGKEEKIKDGMDLGIIAFNHENFTLEFAGAFNSLFFVRNGNLNVYRGDRYSIEAGSTDEDMKFTNHEIDIETGDMIYLSTDGYPDQFGSAENKKFKISRLRELVLEIWNLPIQDQKERLEKEIIDWMGDLEQIDDILFVGTKIPPRK